jgi:hypothetical protein
MGVTRQEEINEFSRTSPDFSCFKTKPILRQYDVSNSDKV